eukprot:CAMPEP_0115348700 /NCGR_PEP_ID=MMETSP0270-20121206/95537_1 /TAXON_ID=71861 /ORGANISM="Scrippsiella trochoidea, Strain CCMP3099" /LENGTH=429 /DNA_ID=CAMNT_0002770673 /DNA_START=147 /DNA_END=1432 /DNA_ORIENTATION=+
MAAERRFDEMEVGAGDQGTMSGYVRDETEGCMSLMHRVATRLGRKLTDLRKSDVLLWLRPDGKTQVAVEYLQRVDGSVEPQKIHTRLEATAPSMEDMNKFIVEEVVRKTLKKIKCNGGEHYKEKLAKGGSLLNSASTDVATSLAERCRGVSEETTTGVHLLREMAKKGELSFLAISIDDYMMRSKFDNVYGCRQSLLDGCMRTADVMIGGKRTLMCRSEDLGMSSAFTMRVLILEIDLACILQACVEGFQVVTRESVKGGSDMDGLEVFIGIEVENVEVIDADGEVKRGMRIVSYLKEDRPEFPEECQLKDSVNKYSEFIGYPSESYMDKFKEKENFEPLSREMEEGMGDISAEEGTKEEQLVKSDVSAEFGSAAVGSARSSEGKRRRRRRWLRRKSRASEVQPQMCACDARGGRAMAAVDERMRRVRP